MAAKKKLKLNIPLLKKIKAHILEEPKRYDQDEVVKLGTPGEPHSRRREDNKPDPFPACGTVACIGGWAYVLSQAKKTLALPDDPAVVLNKAEKLLGLNTEQSEILFCGGGEEWPKYFKNRFQKAKTLKTQAKVAADFLDNVVETKGQILTDQYDIEHGSDEEFPEESYY